MLKLPGSTIQFHSPLSLALTGFAVVSPDYAGLRVSHFASGTRFLHTWVSLPSQANDLANAVLEARSAFPSISENFVARGHAQGGGTAHAFSERQDNFPESGYLGTIAISTLTTATQQVAVAFAHPSNPFQERALITRP